MARAAGLPGSQRADYRQALLVLSVALLHGLIYLFLIPAWQHYDEPNHFEVAWLSAHLRRMPRQGDYNPSFSYAVVESMLFNGFFDRMAEKPLLESPDQQVEIPGYSQLDEPPLYYLLASLPLRLTDAAPVEFQLAAARLVSLLLYLLTVFASWGMAIELTRPGHALRWMLPLTLALLPGFVDAMTAVNNDAAAVAVFSLFFWGSVRMLRRGFTLPGFLWITTCAALSIFTKNTAVFALVLWPVVLTFSLVRGRWRRLAWALALLALALLAVFSLRWGDAAYWHRATSQLEFTRAPHENAVVGEHVLRLVAPAQVNPPSVDALVQLVPLDVSASLRGKTVTLGGWMWASQPLSTITPALVYPQESIFNYIEAGTTPVFFAFQVQVPEDNFRLWVTLIERLPLNTEVQLYYDGLVLVEGRRPIDEPPLFSTPDGGQGEWGGRPFVNLLRNGSAESAWPRIRPQVDLLGVKLAPNNSTPSAILAAVIDWRASWALFAFSLQRLINTFWAWFGWGHVPLLGGYPGAYWALAGVTLLAAVGALIGVIRRWRWIPVDIFWLTLLSLLLAWVAAITRGVAYLSEISYYLPVARHIYPVIIPMALVFTFGWLELFHGVAMVTGRGEKPDGEGIVAPRYARSMHRMQVIYVACFLALDLWSILTIVQFYNML